MKRLIILGIVLGFSVNVYSSDFIYIKNEESGLFEQVEIDNSILHLILDEQAKAGEEINSFHNFTNQIDERIDSGDRTKG